MAKVLIQGQSLLDLAVQEYGTAQAVMQLALGNDLAVTDAVGAGNELVLPDSEVKNIDVAGYFSKNSILPATGLSSEDLGQIEDNDPCNLCKCFI